MVWRWRWCCPGDWRGTRRARVPHSHAGWRQHDSVRRVRAAAFRTSLRGCRVTPRPVSRCCRGCLQLQWFRPPRPAVCARHGALVVAPPSLCGAPAVRARLTCVVVAAPPPPPHRWLTHRWHGRGVRWKTAAWARCRPHAASTPPPPPRSLVSVAAVERAALPGVTSRACAPTSRRALASALMPPIIPCVGDVCLSGRRGRYHGGAGCVWRQRQRRRRRQRPPPVRVQVE